jgi:manganese peroxidase
MAVEFGAAMVKLSLLGQNKANLIDCSDVIPAAKPLTGQPFFPPTLTQNNVAQGCMTSRFPTLSTAPGPATSVPSISENEVADDFARAIDTDGLDTDFILESNWFSPYPIKPGQWGPI